MCALIEGGKDDHDVVVVVFGGVFPPPPPPVVVVVFFVESFSMQKGVCEERRFSRSKKCRVCLSLFEFAILYAPLV